MSAETIEKKESESRYQLGKVYDFPIPKRPNMGAKGVEGDHGQKFDTYGANSITFSDFVKANPEKLVLMQTEGYNVTAMLAKEVAGEYKSRSSEEFRNNCMVLIPLEER